MADILIVDDEDAIRETMMDILGDEGYRVFGVASGEECLQFVEKKQNINIIFLDVWLGSMDGMEVLNKLKLMDLKAQVIMISGHASVDIAVKAVKMGAFDFLEKPLSIDKILTLTRNALSLNNLKLENQSLKEQVFLNDKFIFKSNAMQEIYSLIKQSSNSDARIMILGSNGTGKEMVAKLIHQNSPRKNGPFIAINCAAIPDNLLESELFGYEKGAFTGAYNTKKGFFELADKGTLFLDEIADMSLQSQAKVLRAIQEMTITRLGSPQSISIDIRIISATNKSISESISKNLFREDLFFRLSIIPIKLPDLKDRLDDIDILCDYFFETFKNNGIKKALSVESLDFLKKYDWPGNIRELKNFIERICVMSESEIINLEDVKKYLDNSQNQKESQNIEEFNNLNFNDAKDNFERNYIISKLKEVDFNVNKAAQNMEMYPGNLYNKIKKLNIDIKK